ncbi:MAG: hypothetical protein PHC28_00625 [Flavobacterium sp.]|uniref:hypothetical protein n=1 Tax=Flavobacterium sp. TaxID=239 RepID=UPI00260FCD2A|nr:hypothetical protein [Flavobacterium sp.]MDD5148971.1 hypothetical protein [Flavobacterium sp.]
MKKIYLFLLCGIIFHVQSQTSANSNFSSPDKDQLIQKCLVFQPLVDKIPVEVQARISDYYILNHGMEITFSQVLKVNGKGVSFLTKGELTPTKPYFLFHTLNIENDKAFVRYYFIYTNNGKETTIPITIDFVKINSVWQVFNYTI